MKAHKSSWLALALKVFVALLAGMVVPAIGVVILFSRSYAATEGQSSDLSQIGTVFLFAFAFTAAYALFLGLPLVLVGIRVRLIRWWSAILIGALVGYVPSALISGQGLIAALPMGGFGAIGGLAFWIVWHFWGGRKPGAAAANPQEQVSSPAAPESGA